jgi:hypothetical protein
MDSVVISVETALTNNTLMDLNLPDNWHDQPVVITGISFADLDHALTLGTVELRTGVIEYPIVSQVTPAASTFYFTNCHLVINGTYSPFLRVTGGTVGDRIVFTVFGYVPDIIEAVA